MAIGCRLLVDGTAQLQGLDYGAGAKIEVLVYQLQYDFLIHLGRAESLSGNGKRTSYPDGISDLDLQAIGQSRRDDVLGSVAGEIGSGTVYLGGVLAGESAAAVAGNASVGVDQDLAAGKPCVSHGPADDETASCVDVELGLLVHQLGGNDLVDHHLADVAVDYVIAHCLTVLGADDHRFYALGYSVLVLYGDLRLAVGAKVRESPVLSHLGQTSAQLV